MGCLTLKGVRISRLRAPCASRQGPSPLPQCYVDAWPTGGQSPRPAPAPPLPGALPPPGRALASVLSGPAGLRGTVARGGGETRVAFPVPARTGVLRHFGLPGLTGRGHRPCHRATLASGPAGGQSPRPAPAPPPAGASPPPGRALASVSPGPAGLQGTVPRGRGKRGSRFLFPPDGAIPFPGPGQVSRQASSRVAASALCRSAHPA